MASADIVGQVLPVRIDSLERYSLLGEIAHPAAAPSTPAATSSVSIGA